MTLNWALLVFVEVIAKIKKLQSAKSEALDKTENILKWYTKKLMINVLKLSLQQLSTR